MSLALLAGIILAVLYYKASNAQRRVRILEIDAELPRVRERLEKDKASLAMITGTTQRDHQLTVAYEGCIADHRDKIEKLLEEQRRCMVRIL